MRAGPSGLCLGTTSISATESVLPSTYALTGVLCYRPTMADSVGWLEIALKQWRRVSTEGTTMQWRPLTLVEVQSFSKRIGIIRGKSWAIK